jgi:cytochrome P450
MMGGAGGSAMLLMNPQVREQLELSEDQIQRLEDLQADMRDEMQEMFRGGGGGEDAREKMQEVMGRVQKEIDGVLLKHQREQLAGMTASMTMRRGGASGVLNNPDLVKQLGLSESEAEKFREQAEELQAKQDEEIAKLRERYNERVIALLPKEAQEKMKEWLKTEVPEFNFGGRGGEGGGRGQQGRGQQGRGQRPLDF